MRIIEQKYWQDLEVGSSNDKLFINQEGDRLVIDNQGALQLIEILKEFVGNQKTIPFNYYPEYDESIDYPSDALVRHNGEVKLAISIKGIC